MYTVTFKLFDLVNELERLNQKRYSWEAIAKSANVSRGTLYNMQANATKGVSLETIARLLAFFEAEGMPIRLEELFEVEKVCGPDVAQ